MAILRFEKQYWNGDAWVCDGAVEEDDDLTAISAGTASYHGAAVNDVAEGSAMYCQEDGNVYMMQADGSWEAMG